MMGKKILIVDDYPLNRQMLSDMLCDEYEILEADDGQTALRVLNQSYKEIKAILLDIVMPNMDGFEVLEKIQENPFLAQIPVIVITSNADEDSEIRALTLGALDFATKPFRPTIIKQRIRNAIHMQENASFINSIQKDELTGIYNRKTFFVKAAEMVKRQKPGYYVMAAFDVDKFKVINDRYGTMKGDEVLRNIANVLKDSFDKSGGICARFTADDFALLYPCSIMNTDMLEKVNARIRAVENFFAYVTVSVGRYIADDLSIPVEGMYDRALLAMMSVKEQFDNKVALFNDEMRIKMLLEQDIAREMKTALNEGQFEVWIQPQYNHQTGEIIGAEALVRWRHPEKGIIMPMTFIPLFERNGFIYELDAYVWEESCKMLRCWLDEGLSPLPLAVNIARSDLLRAGFLDTITETIKRYQLSPELLRLEITESAFVGEQERIIRVINELIAYGFTVVVDNFGNSFSSINILKDVPAQILKMDMHFFMSTDHINRSGNIIESIIRMAKWLGMAVIAERVEEKEQADYLESIGCYYIQGYYYAKPMQKEEYQHLLQNCGKESKITRLETIEQLDNNEFWNPKSMETLIFNSYIGGACIFEYHEGRVELLRVNKSYSKELGMVMTPLNQNNDLDHSRYTDQDTQTRLHQCVNHAIQSMKEASCELKLVDSSEKEAHTEYIHVTLRVIARTGSRFLFYCVIVNTTARHKAEEERLEAVRRKMGSERQLNIILENITAGVSAVQIGAEDTVTYLYTNDKFHQLFGYTKEQIEKELSGTIRDFMLPEFVEEVRQKLKAAVKNAKTTGYDYMARRRDGELIWVHAKTSICYMNAQEEPVYVTIYNNITQEKRAALRIQELNAKLSGCEVFVQMNITKEKIEEFQSIYTSQKEMTRLLTEPDEYERYLKKEVYEDEYRAVYNALSYKGLRKHYAEGDLKYSVEYRKHMSNKEVRWFVATALLLEDGSGNSVNAFIYSRDIDERKKKRIARNQIVDMDTDDITIVNIRKETCQVIDVYGDSVISRGDAGYYDNLEKYIISEVAEEDKVRCREFFLIENLCEVIEKQGYAELSYWLISPKGYNRRKSAKVTFLDSSHRDLLLVGRDITDLFEKEQEQQTILQQAADMANYANQAKSNFLSRMSHDMRTPLNAVIGLTGLAKENIENPVKAEEYLNAIESSSQYLLGLINDTLDLSKIENGKMEIHEEAFSLNEFLLGIDAVIRPLMDAKNIDFQVNLKDDVKAIRVDKMRFTQVFYNLLSNAAKYTPEGGKVVFSSEEIPPSDDKFGMRFLIKDNGIGMSKEYLKVLFDPFSQENRPTQSERKGTGLGLAIVKQIVELVGGTIHVESELNQGTTFTVELFAECLEGKLEEQPKIKYDAEKLKGLHILLVDDNEISGMIFQEMLLQKECIVDMKENGLKAVEAFERSAQGYYDIVITDIRMPVMDGLEEARRIRSLSRQDAKQIPIIAVTADAYSDILDKILTAGMNGRLIKPVTIDTLCQTVVRLLEGTYTP